MHSQGEGGPLSLRTKDSTAHTMYMLHDIANRQPIFFFEAQCNKFGEMFDDELAK
jgi:hypothetical protein